MKPTFRRLLVAWCAMAMTAVALDAGYAAPAKPNVVLIISDDMGYADMPGFGQNAGIPMPQMERLRRGGVILSDAYVSASICVPSRMGVFTGRHQARWGAYTNVYEDAPAYHRFQREKTMAQYFKEAGYATALVGKWHLSGNGNIDTQPSDYLPDAKGFDEITIIPGGMSGFFPGSKLYHKGGTVSEAPEYLTDHFGKLAADFVRRKKAAPFLLMLTFNAPHAPLHTLAEDINQSGLLEGYDPKRYVPHLAKNRREPAMDRQVYAGMMRSLDRNIGRLLDALDTAGVADNTLVIFINDNGGPSPTAEIHSYNQADNRPYRGYKFDCLEGGIRVPMAIRWPAKVPPGRIFSGLVSSMDILPTALAACGIPLPAEKERALDGVDLLPFLLGASAGDPHDFLAWQVYFGNEKTTGQAAIRQGRWKLHQHAPVSAGPLPERWELYDLSVDPGETTDLAGAHPERVRTLDAVWRKWKSQMQPLEPPVPVKGKETNRS